MAWHLPRHGAHFNQTQYQQNFRTIAKIAVYPVFYWAYREWTQIKCPGNRAESKRPRCQPRKGDTASRRGQKTTSQPFP